MVLCLLGGQLVHDIACIYKKCLTIKFSCLQELFSAILYNFLELLLYSVVSNCHSKSYGVSLWELCRFCGRRMCMNLSAARSVCLISCGSCRPVGLQSVLVCTRIRLQFVLVRRKEGEERRRRWRGVTTVDEHQRGAGGRSWRAGSLYEGGLVYFVCVPSM